MDHNKVPSLQSIVNYGHDSSIDSTSEGTDFDRTIAKSKDSLEQCKLENRNMNSDSYIPIPPMSPPKKTKMVSARRRKSCPVCKKDNLLKLSNHLTVVHNITGNKRKEYCCSSKASPSHKRVKNGRRRRTCPLCKKPNLLLLSNHLRFVHGLTGLARKDILKLARTKKTLNLTDNQEVSNVGGNSMLVEQSTQTEPDCMILSDILRRVQQFIMDSEKNSSQDKQESGMSDKSEDLVSLNDSFDRKMDLDEWNRKEFAGTDELQRDLPSITSSLKEIFPEYDEEMQSEVQPTEEEPSSSSTETELKNDKRKKRFSTEQEEQLAKSFDFYISNKKTPPLCECRRYLIFSRTENETPRHPKTIQDKVRNLIKSVQQ